MKLKSVLSFFIFLFIFILSSAQFKEISYPIERFVVFDNPKDAMHGIYTIGTGSGYDYEHLSDAVSDLILNGVDDSVVFELSADYNSNTENYPIIIPVFAGASQSNTLTIRPAEGTTHIFENSNSSIFSIFASNVVIDGSNGTSKNQNLLISNTYTTDSIAGVAIDNSENITIKNCEIRTSGNNIKSMGIATRQSTNLLFKNNRIYSAQSGISIDTCENVTVQGNIIGSKNISEYLDFGVKCNYSSDIYIDQNVVYNLIDDDVYNSNLSIHAFALNYLSGEVQVTNNYIDSLIHTGSNNVVQAIALNQCNTDNFIIANNRISNIASDSYSFNVPGAIAINSPDIDTVTIIHNSINMPENNDYGIGGTEDNVVAGGLIINAGSGICFKNNIISNTLGKRDGSSYFTLGSAIALNFNTNPFSEIDNNVYYYGGDYSISTLAMNPNGLMDLAAWQSFTGDEKKSISQEDICFKSDDSLQLNSCSPAIARAQFYENFSTDINGVNRDTNYTTIGAYEYEIVQATDIFIDVPVKGMGWVTFQPGNGNKKAIFMKEGDVLPESAMPENGQTYLANEFFGEGDQIGSTGWYCIYNAQDYQEFWTYADNGTYTFMVCEYFGSPGNEIYITDTAYLNPNIGYITSSLKENSENLNIYPNPTSGIVNFDVCEQIKEIKIYNYLGKIIRTEQKNINDQIDISNLKNGIYLIEIKTLNAIYSSKIILNKK